MGDAHPRTRVVLFSELPIIRSLSYAFYSGSIPASVTHADTPPGSQIRDTLSMILALVGHRFLIEERAKEELRHKGFQPRDVPWLGNSDEELTPELIASHTQGGLFGPAALVVELSGTKDYKALLEVLNQAQDAIAVVLDAENWTSSEPSSEVTRKKKAQEARTKTYEKLGAELTMLPAPVKGALVKWIADRAKSMKLILEPEAGKALAEIFPDDPPAIASELEKLSILEGKVDAETVRRVVNHLPPTNVFAMLEAAAKRKAGEAANHLERLLDAGEDPFKLMGALIGQYQLNARAFALIQRDPVVRHEEAGKILSVHPFRAQKALEAVRGLSENRIRKDLQKILEADTGMKSGLEPRLTLERLVLELAV
jgi:DNA polymerase III subunit delta